MRLPKTRRGILVCTALIVLSAAIVWSATTVTVTKTGSRMATANYYDGTTNIGVYLMETDTGFNLSYSVVEYDWTQTPPYTILEQGYGVIDKTDAGISATSAWVDVDTSGIAVIGDGGVIDLEWTVDGLSGYETSSKYTYKYGTMKQTTWGATSSSSAVVSGDVFDDPFTGTGQIRTNKGKVIMQTK